MPRERKGRHFLQTETEQHGEREERKTEVPQRVSRSWLEFSECQEQRVAEMEKEDTEDEDEAGSIGVSGQQGSEWDNVVMETGFHHREIKQMDKELGMSRVILALNAWWSYS